MAKKKPADTELDHFRKVRLIDRIFTSIDNLVRYGVLALIFYFGYKMVESLAGKITFADIGISMLFDSRTLAIIFGSGGVVYGLVERRLRKKTVQRLQPRIDRYEQLHDSKRSSSTLTLDGETNPRDNW